MSTQPIDQPSGHSINRTRGLGGGREGWWTLLGSGRPAKKKKRRWSTSSFHRPQSSDTHRIRLRLLGAPRCCCGSPRPGAASKPPPCCAVADALLADHQLPVFDATALQDCALPAAPPAQASVRCGAGAGCRAQGGRRGEGHGGEWGRTGRTPAVARCCPPPCCPSDLDPRCCRFDPATGLLHATPNMNVVNLVLRLFGPCTELWLCLRILAWQVGWGRAAAWNLGDGCVMSPFPA